MCNNVLGYGISEFRLVETVFINVILACGHPEIRRKAMRYKGFRLKLVPFGSTLKVVAQGVTRGLSFVGSAEPVAGETHFGTVPRAATRTWSGSMSSRSSAGTPGSRALSPPLRRAASLPWHSGGGFVPTLPGRTRGTEADAGMEVGRAFMRDDRDHASTATALPWARDEHGIGPLLGRVGEDVGGRLGSARHQHRDSEEVVLTPRSCGPGCGVPSAAPPRTRASRPPP